MATVSEALHIAIQHHHAGRLQAAEQIYRQILQVDQNQADAIHLLGLLAYQVGRSEVAVEYIGRAIALKGNVAEFHNNLAQAYHALGRLSEAIACCRRALELGPALVGAHYNLAAALKEQGNLEEAIASLRQALQLQPDLAEAHRRLGLALAEQGKAAEAAACYRRAIELEPHVAETHNFLGNVCGAQGKVDEAAACYRRCLALKPEFAEAHNNLGALLTAQKDFQAAEACLRQALELRPDFAEAHSNLGNVFKAQGNLEKAMACYRRAAELKPGLAEAWNNLGLVLAHRGELEEAAASLRRAVALKPDYVEAHNNLGVVCKEQGMAEEAIACYRRALQLNPEYADAHNNLGVVFTRLGRMDEAVAACRRAVELDPDDASAHSNLGVALKEQGLLDEAMTALRRALALQPGFVIADCNLVYTELFHPGFNRAMLREELCRWNRAHAEPFQKLIQPHVNDRSPARRLRLGYISPDFCDHVIGRNLLPLLREHDRQGFEIVCYSDAVRRDDLTDQFRSFAHRWRETAGRSDAEVADGIREDRIDILVDLSLHLDRNRLLVFARRPAPVQATFAGYPGSTGLSTIDYRLTDPNLDPPGLNDEIYAEESIRLPDSFWCYDPLDTQPEVNGLPALERGYLTFGCLNNFCKVNPLVLKLWARVLRAVDGSKLMMLTGEGAHRQAALSLLAGEGVGPDRVRIVGSAARREYLGYYHGIDIGLDTLPYNGHTTSLDSYWMGVPVVTLVGETVVGRAGLSQLTNLGLPEFIAHTADDYVRIAAELAQDLPRLSGLRGTLRDRMKSSPLMDAPRFARGIEAAYRTMWHRWCAK